LEQNGSVKSGTVVALFTGGAFFGAFAAGFCDPLGRRGTICMAACIFLVGGTIQTSGVVLGMLYAGRFIAGFGVGILCMIIPVFQAEISSHKIRGAITSLQQLFNAVGQIVAAWTGYGCYLTWHGTGNSKEWRIPLGIQMTPAIFLASMIYLFPESPRWLISHGKHERGLEVLAKLHAHGDKDDPYVIAEYELIMGQVIEEKNDDNNSYARLFTRRSNLRRMILATFIQAGRFNLYNDMSFLI
jgi:MFS family permease